MRHEDGRFYWTVSTEGHEWVEGFPALSDNPRDESEKTKKLDYLTDRQPIGTRSRSIRPYKPLVEYTGLFRIFAATMPSYETIREFADRFGLLGGDSATEAFTLEVTGKQPILPGERPAPWFQQMHSMKRLIELWDLVRHEDVDQLKELIIWKWFRSR